MEDVLLRSLICSYTEIHYNEEVLQTFSVKDGSIETIHWGDKRDSVYHTVLLLIVDRNSGHIAVLQILP